MAFLDIFLKNSQVSIFTEIRLVEAELFHADGLTKKKGQTDRQTDMRKI